MNFLFKKPMPNDRYAVATGIFDFQTLEKAGADYVFEDLTDSDRFMSILSSL